MRALKLPRTLLSLFLAIAFLFSSLAVQAEQKFRIKRVDDGQTVRGASADGTGSQSSSQTSPGPFWHTPAQNSSSQTPASSSQTPHKSSRLVRPGSSGSPENATSETTTTSNMLQGGVDVTSLGTLADPSQFAPLNGNTSSTGLSTGLNQTGATPLNAGVGLYTNKPIQSGARKIMLQGDLNQNDLHVLASSDVLIMQDRSSSMGESLDKKDNDDDDFLKRILSGGSLYTPSLSMSKWEWCLSQASDLTRQSARVPNWAMTLVMFSNEFDVYHNISLQQIPQIYSRNGIFIGTKLARPLEEQLQAYFRQHLLGRKRPLLVAVITDGKPQDMENLVEVIVNATRQMNDPNQVRITFLQVGCDRKGVRHLAELDSGLVPQGARYDIVDVVPFTKLSQIGLARSLVDTIRAANAAH